MAFFDIAMSSLYRFFFNCLYGSILFFTALNPVLLLEAQQRARPHIDESLGYKTILTDKDTLLRGVSLAFDGGDPFGSKPILMPERASFIALKSAYGLNAVHVYLEGNSSTNPSPVGVSLKYADELVALTRELGLYLILTIGCNGENGTIHSIDKAFEFWTLYADRYKGESHVIFEAHNEPVGWTLNNFTQEDWERQLNLYLHIRNLAPDSLILLGSFMSFFDPGGTPTYGSQWLESQGVSWDNAGFAFHGYWDLDQVDETIRVFHQSTEHPALLCTEFNPYDSEKGFNNLCEIHRVGWMQFEWFSRDSDLLGFKGKLEKAGTVWFPEDETASWPSLGGVQFPTPGQAFGLYSRSARKFLRIDNDKIIADSDNYSGASNQNFFVEFLGKGYVAIRNNQGDYLSLHPSNKPQGKSLRFSRFPSNYSEFKQAYRWMSLPWGDICLQPRAHQSRLLSTEDDRLVLSDYSAKDNGAQVNSATTFFIALKPMQSPRPICAYKGPATRVPMQEPLLAADYDHKDSPSNDKEGDIYRKDYGIDICIDADGLPYVGWFDDGEILDYSLFVETDGRYNLDLEVATNSDSGAIELFHDDDPLGHIEFRNTGGWNHFRIIRALSLRLTEGNHRLRIVSRGGLNIKSLIIK